MRILWRVMGYAAPYRWQVAGSVVFALAASVLSLLPAWAVKLAIDDAIPRGDLGQLGVYLGLFAGASLLAAGVGTMTGYLQQYVGQRVIFDLRQELFAKLQSQSLRFFDERQSGQLMSRVMGDVAQVQTFVSWVLPNTIEAAVLAAAAVVVLVLLSWQLALVALSVLPVVIALQLRQRGFTAFLRNTRAAIDQMSVVVQEAIAGAKTIQGFGRGPVEAGRFDGANSALRDARINGIRVMAVIMPGQELLTGVSLVLVLVFGALQIMSGNLTVGVLTAAMVYVYDMWRPLRTGLLSGINQQAQLAAVSGERLFEMLDTPLVIEERPGAIDPGGLRGAIEFEDVTFSYGSARPLLSNVSFRVQPGETVAIVGPSGSGKTTIVHLVPRFYDVSAGTVRLDGRDVRDLKVSALRSRIGFVLQDTFLFNATVGDNIRYGRPDADDADVVSAARAAHAHEFIVELPEGYDTLVGERGVRLSGGQRQRIAIARALLIDPPVLVLDEATSSVDARTDVEIHRALDRLMKGRTTVVIAHRVSTVQRADRILVLEAGRVIDSGTHEELIARCATYAYLCEMQLELQRESAAS